MDAHEIRRQRVSLGYSVPLLAEVLRVDARLIRDWESGARPVPDWLEVSMSALMKARSKPEDDFLAAGGTFASRRRTLMRSKIRG